MTVVLALLFLAGNPSGECQAISASGEAFLGAPVIVPNGEEPIVSGGALPAEATFGPFVGMLSSVVVDHNVVDGVQHMRLHHYFETERGAFWTNDTATCTPVEDGPPSDCDVVTEMEIVRGTGIFANATGTIHNAGRISMTDPSMETSPYGVLRYDMKGEICLAEDEY